MRKKRKFSESEYSASDYHNKRKIICLQFLSRFILLFILTFFSTYVLLLFFPNIHTETPIFFSVATFYPSPITNPTNFQFVFSIITGIYISELEFIFPQNMISIVDMDRHYGSLYHDNVICPI